MVLAAAQSPLLGDKSQAAQLIPRLCSVILNAPSHCRHVSPVTCCQQHALGRQGHHQHGLAGIQHKDIQSLVFHQLLGRGSQMHRGIQPQSRLHGSHAQL